MTCYFQQPRISKILNVNPSLFASIDQIETIDNRTTYKIKIQYEVDMQVARTVGCQTIRTQLISKIVKPTQLSTASSNKELVKNVTRQTTQISDAASEQQKYIISQVKTDLTSYVDNTTIINNEGTSTDRSILSPRRRTKTRSVALVKPKKFLIKSTDSIKSTSNEQPNFNQRTRDLQQLTEPDTLGFGSALVIKSLMQDMIFYSGLDPSSVIDLDHVSLTPNLAVRGKLLKRRSMMPDILSKEQATLRDAILKVPNIDKIPQTTNDLSSNDSVVILGVDDNRFTRISDWLTFDAARLNVDGNQTNIIIVRIEAMQIDTGLTVDSREFSIDLSQHIVNYYAPIKPPRLMISRGGSETTLEITQVDKRAIGIKLFRKVIHRCSVDVDDYALVGEYPLVNRQHLTIPIPTPINSYHVYRAISVGVAKVLSHDYTNIIVKPKKIYPSKGISLTSTLDPMGIALQVRNIPSDVVSIQVMVKNATTKSAWSAASDIMLVTDDIRLSDVMTFVDTNVKHRHVYDYAVNLFYFMGRNDLAGSTSLTFLKSDDGKVDTKIVDLKVDDANLNVTFNIQTNINDQVLDQLKSLLDKQGTLKYFDNTLMNSRDQFKKLIAHKIDRIDLTAGEKETFNVVTDEQFDDLMLGPKNAVKPLRIGHDYRYEIFTLLRAPETLLNDFVVTKVDELTRKKYHFKPSTFLHPLTIERGTMVTQRSVTLNHSQDELVHGIISSPATVTINMTNNRLNITNVNAMFVDKSTIWVTWQVIGNTRNIDHFLILKETAGVRVFVGKAHMESTDMRFIHHVTDNDLGQHKYVVMSVFNDYSLGEGVYSAPIVVNQ